MPAGSSDGSWVDLINAVWRYIVRPIAVGGMMTGAAFTLFRMRNGLFDGLKRAVSDLRTTAKPEETIRTEQYMSPKIVFALIGVMFACMIALYIYLSHQVLGGIVAAAVMLVIAFFFAAVSGYLVGTIGSMWQAIPDFRIDPYYIDHRGAADGVFGSVGTGRRCGGAGCRGGGLRFVSSGWRTPAGF